ncbi:hypothetical protein VTO73DRAFT_12730 [Trametes versicolor]
MVLIYEELGRYSNGHDGGITKVAFSPSGTYLATAGLDNRVCIWGVSSKHLLHSFEGSSTALSLKWIPPSEDTLLCGLHDGNMAILKIAPTHVSVSGFWAHAYPVECLAFNPGSKCLASGARSELLTWLWDEKTSKFNLDSEPGELKKPTSETDEVLITSLHWMSAAGSSSLLLVTYMYHGLLLIDTTNWSRCRTIPFHGRQIASASLSDDGNRLATSNVIRGFEIHSMTTGAPLCSINNDAGDASPTPVLFVHGGLALLGGSTAGMLRIWDVLDTATGDVELNVPEEEDPEPEVMHELPIPYHAKTLAIDAYYDEDKDEFFVAAGSMSDQFRSVCLVWRAEEQGNGYMASGGRRWRSRVLGAALAVVVISAAALQYGLLGA